MATGDTPRKPLEGMGGPTRIISTDKRVYGCEHCRKNIDGEPWKSAPRSPNHFCSEAHYDLWHSRQV